ncbi:hypothetical protein V6Z12_A03G182800 [Gossypium hirsutum]
MGLVGVQGDGNGEMALSLGSKNKYKRMDSELSDDFEDDASHHHHQLGRKKSTRKYVLACAIFASLNNVLLGYDVGVMSGAIIFIQEDLKITENRVEEARSVLLKTNENDKEVEERLSEIVAAAGISNGEKNEEKAVWRELLSPSPSLRRMLITGFGIQCFQQITGIDATVYYSPEIFHDAGIVNKSKLLAATVAVGVTKTALILIATFLVDRVGRKPLLYVSTIGMTVCLFTLSISLAILGKGQLGIAMALLCVCGNVAFFSVGMGPVCWIVTSEIFPLRLRAQASALGAVGNRVCSGFVAMSFLSLARTITVGGTFFLFSLFSALSVAFVYKLVPETKGKSLEQIELLFQNHNEWDGSEMELGDAQHLVHKA